MLASNDDTFTVFARKRAIENIEATAEILANTLELEYDYVYTRLTKTTSSEVTIKKQVSKKALDSY